MDEAQPNIWNNRENFKREQRYEEKRKNDVGIIKYERIIKKTRCV